MTTQSTQKSYFNLHTHGIGYLNNIREVPVKKGSPYLACRIAALMGESSQVEYCYFDCNVVGEEAISLIKRCEKALTEKRKVLLSFVLGDLRVEQFTYNADSKYHKKGDCGVSLKTRLIRIKSISIEGKDVYRELQKDAQAA